MDEREIVEAVKRYVMRRSNDWKFIMGREIIGKNEFLKKLDRDEKFRETIVKMIINLSIDILTREEKSD